MKIGIIVKRLNIQGGVQRHVLEVAQELKARGHDIALYTFHYSPETCYPARLAGLRVVSLRDAEIALPPRLFETKMKSNWGALMREERAARRLAYLIDPDTELLNPHDHPSEKVAHFFKRRLRRVPSVWVIHDMPTHRVSMLRARAVDPHYRVTFVKRIVRRILDFYEAHRFVQSQNRIVVLDRRDQTWAREAYGREAAIVRNGIAIKEFPLARRTPPEGDARIMMSGIFFPHRRFEDGIRALALLRAEGSSATLTIAGDPRTDPTYHARLTALVDELALGGAVRFAGVLSEEALRDAYAAHDVFLFPNHLQSWGLAVFEAMASGLPVVVSRSAGASEVLLNRRHALIAAPCSPSSLRDAIVELARNAELYQTLVKNGRQFVESELSWQKTTDTLEKIFVECRNTIPPL